MSQQVNQEFIDQVWAVPYRDLPWRRALPDGHFDPYRIWISEIMLQQTQVGRVMPKYEKFMVDYPTVESLAAASLADVLRQWSGLGYNRRAKFIHQTAQTVVSRHKGQFPRDKRSLIELPGIGANTAGAILVYAFNQPEVFVETNIRTVYIHHFFGDNEKVSDIEILRLVSESLNLVEGNYREFFWALMDYGTLLKQSHGNNIRQSSSYVRQSTFQGSRRQIRGQIILLLSERALTRQDLRSAIEDDRLEDVLSDLLAEQLVAISGSKYRLP